MVINILRTLISIINLMYHFKYVPFHIDYKFIQLNWEKIPVRASLKGFLHNIWDHFFGRRKTCIAFNKHEKGIGFIFVKIVLHIMRAQRAKKYHRMLDTIHSFSLREFVNLLVNVKVKLIISPLFNCSKRTFYHLYLVKVYRNFIFNVSIVLNRFFY